MKSLPFVAALLTPYTWAELQERYQALREAEARRVAPCRATVTATRGDR
jgi:hypothetical protein